MSDLNIGGHLSLGRSPRKTVEWAAESGFGSMQIFASSPGAWKSPVLREVETDDFVRARQEHDVDPLMIHAIYLINLASADPALVRRSRESLVLTLRAGAAMGARGIITHIGSHAGRGFEAVANQVAEGLLDVLSRAPEDVQLILENSAGAGGIIGSTLDELGELLRLAGRHPRLNVALDTAHLAGAGWDFQQAGQASRMVSEIDRAIGLDRLVVVHANDSRVPVGSRKDRHANIGEGHIGLEGFRNLLAETSLRLVPWILETPDLEQRVEDLTNLRALAVQPLTTGIPLQSQTTPAQSSSCFAAG